METTHGVLAVDVGGGTQDVLCWFQGQLLENAIKMILPSPTVLVARRLDGLRREGRDVVLVGKTMGGGPSGRAVQRHLQAGLKVYALPDAARTLHDDLDRVRDMGVRIVDEPPAGVPQVVLQDLDVDRLGKALGLFDIPLPGSIAVAVQDHGFSPAESNRLFRFRYWQDFLASGGDLKTLATTPPPAYMTRMRAVRETAPGALVLDTGTAAILGALMDSRGARWNEEGLTVVNVGNFHTVVALVRRGRVLAIYEHHTGRLTPEKLAAHLDALRRKELTAREVFEDNGHGCAYGAGGLEGAFHRLLVTGPRRRQLFEDPGLFAAPFGDMMLSGCFGLLQAAAWAGGFQLERE
ncbi:Uncharacterized protein, DUF1786 family [Desulfacinum infernum DSM 9756]|jgi:uncharacterized protein (DUF1786 family)|uniref:Uncharacterized protein, DUF1786 family n=1 Tax=Desulfacinum infernum DSM 9756 TaxID=1121391 RepID=A0A1M5I6R1_9BACT|nr:DUF1786 domain-containing protein [Desulfacinum infernum]SHG23590.1 Uncharacterized protein, DUF1786 family [Desulfacinum infernum DSM 9756]